MSIQSSLFSANHDDDPYANSHAGERALNRAIVTAEISRSFEEYLEIFDRFYAEDIEVSSATSAVPIRGKARVGWTSLWRPGPVAHNGRDRRRVNLYPANHDAW